jgi:hypothetical protein
METETNAALATTTTSDIKQLNLDDIDPKYTELTELRTLPLARQQPRTSNNNNTHTTKRTTLQQTPPRLSSIQKWLHETNGPPAVALNTPTSPTATHTLQINDDDKTTWPMTTPKLHQPPPQNKPHLFRPIICPPTDQITHHF